MMQPSQPPGLLSRIRGSLRHLFAPPVPAGEPGPGADGERLCALLRQVFDQLPQSISVRDAQGRLLVSNRDAAPGAGLSAAERAVLRTGEAAPPSGAEGAARHLPLRDAAGTVVGVITLAGEAPQAPAAEPAAPPPAIESELLLETLFEHLPANLLVKDRDRRYVRVNRAFADMLGLRPEDCIGHTWEELAARGGVEIGIVQHGDEETLGRGRSFTEPANTVRFRDGSVRYHRLIKAPLRDRSGAVVGLVGIGMNVTSQIDAERTLRENKALLEAILETAPLPLFARDLAGRYLVANPTYAASIGLPLERIIGHTRDEALRAAGVEIEGGAAADHAVIEGQRPVVVPRQVVHHAGGRTEVYHSVKSPLRDPAGNVVGVVGARLEITEMVRAAEALREREWELSRAQDVAGIGTWRRDIATGTLRWSSHVARIWNYDPAGPAPDFRQLVQRVHPDDREAFLAVRHEAERRGRRFDEVSRIVWPDGSIHHVRSMGEVLLDDAGRPASVLGITQDVTERVQTEQALRDSEERFRAIVENLPDGIAIVDRETGGIVFCNEAFRTLFGVTGEVTQHRAPDFYADPDERAEVLADYRRQGFYGPREVQYRATDGHLFWALASGRVVTYGGRPAYLSAWADVSDRKRAEEALSASRELLRAVFDALPVWVSVKDRDFRYTMVNRQSLKDTGLSEADYIGCHTLELPLGREEMQRNLAFDEEVMHTEGRVVSPPVPHRLPDGRVHHFTHIKVPFRRADGAIVGIVTVSVDETHRMQAEAELRESEARYRDLVETSQHLIFSTDEAARFTYLNPAWEETLGYAPEEMLGRPFTAFKRPAEAERSIGAFQAMMRGEMLRDFDTVYLTRAGEERILTIKAKPNRSPDGTTVSVQGTAVDVTEQRRVEQELRRSRRLLERVIDAIPMWIFAKDAESNYIMVNKAMAEFFEQPKEAFLHRHTSQLHAPSATREKSIADDRWVFTNRQVLDQPEALLQRPDGTAVPFHSTKLPLFDDDGALAGLLGVNRDITEQKRTQAVLEQQRAMMAAVLEGLPAPVFLKDASGRYELVNSAMAAFFGLTVDEMIGVHTAELPGIPQAQRERLAAEDRQVFETGAPFEGTDLERVRSDGTMRLFNVTKTPLFNQAGEVTHIVGHANDVTESRQAERALRESGQIFEQINDAVIVVDPDDRIVRWSKGAERLYGYPAEEIMGSPISRLWPGDVDGAERQQALYELLLPNRGRSAIVERQKKSGERFWLSISLSNLHNEAGELYGIVGTSHDVTELVNSERELRESEKRFRDLVEGSLNGIVVHRGFRPLFVNQAYADIFGYESPDEMLQMETLRPLFDPQELQHFGTWRAELKQRGEELPARFELIGVRKDGSRMHIMNYWRFVEWNGERAVLGTVIDITEQKRTEADLRANKDLLQAVFDTTPHMLFVKDREGRYVMINKGLSTSWQVDTQAMIGQRMVFQDGSTAEQLAPVLETDRLVLATGQTVELERERPMPDGRLHWLRTIKTPLHDASGMVTGIVGLTEDITERRHAEQALRESRQLLRTVIDAIPARIVVRRRDGSMLLANKAMAATTGHTPEDFIADPWQYPALAEREIAAVEARNRQVIESGQPMDFELERTLADGSTEWAHVGKVPLRDESGQVTAVVTVDEPITERKLAELELLASERRYRDLVEGSIQGVLIHRDGRLLSVSQPLAEMLGYAAARELAAVETGWQLVAPDFRPAVLEVHARRSRGETVAPLMEMQLLRKDGTPIWVERRQRIVQWEGEPAVQVVIHNIHDRKLAEVGLRESEQRATQALESLQLAVESAPAGIALYDAEDRLVICNREFRTYFPDGGGSIAPGQTFAEIVQHFVATGGLRAPRRTGKAWLAERVTAHQHPTQPQQLHLADDRRLQVIEHRAESGRISSVYVDVTELARTQAALESLNSELEQRVQERTAELRAAQAELVTKERLATLGLLTGVVSHELRNPLGTIRTSLHLVREVADEAELGIDKTLTRIDRNITRCDRIIDELLTFTRPARENPEPVDMDDLVTEVVSELALPSPGIRIELDLHGQRTIQVDRERMRRALINVVQNAVQAITEQAERSEGRVQVFTRSEAGHYEIRVHDDGPGIAAEHRERIFEPLFSTKGFGVGLGLPIVKQILEAHEGGIDMQSDAGRGTTVVLWLPAPEAV